MGQLRELKKAGQTGIALPARPRVPNRHMEGPPQVMLSSLRALSRANHAVFRATEQVSA